MARRHVQGQVDGIIEFGLRTQGIGVYKEHARAGGKESARGGCERAHFEVRDAVVQPFNVSSKVSVIRRLRGAQISDEISRTRASHF